MKLQHFFPAASFLMLVAACTPKAGNPSAGPAVLNSESRSYSVRGFMRGQVLEDKTVSIEHEDIPGFMPSMTMPFTLKDPREFTGLAVGDAIQFTLTVTDSDSWISGVKKIQPQSVHLARSKPNPAFTEAAERLHEGDLLPAFNLVDQQGRSLSSAALAGKSVLLTFIFTQCPIPTFCPLMSKNFGELQKEITGDSTLRGRVQLLSISFDPSHDTPEVLAQYGSQFTNDLDSWKFATGSSAEINRLTSEFSVYVKAEGGTLSHGLCTVLISPEGRIEKIWRGNGWETAELMEALQKNVAKR